jgi:hypothetical protein
MIEFIDTHTFIQFGITGNYSAIAILHASQITRTCFSLVLVLFYTLRSLSSQLNSVKLKAKSKLC